MIQNMALSANKPIPSSDNTYAIIYSLKQPLLSGETLKTTSSSTSSTTTGSALSLISSPPSPYPPLLSNSLLQQHCTRSDAAIKHNETSSVEAHSTQKTVPAVRPSLLLNNNNGSTKTTSILSNSNNVIQVMCELPVSTFQLNSNTAQPTTTGPERNGESGNSTTTTSSSKGIIITTQSELASMKTKLVPVLVTTSSALCVNQENLQRITMSSGIINSSSPTTTNSSSSSGSTKSTPSVSTSPTQSVYKLLKNSRIGRPRKAEVEILKAEGESSTSEMKCLVCKRVFPRIKSLEAHMRIHTGEKPYQCDFPHCDRSFNQGGQLRTHHRLHTGEKPFKCGVQSCLNRYAHANRSCPNHPSSVLKRFPVSSIETDVDSFPNKDEVAKWLYRYGRDHKIAVDILRYDNPAIKAEVIAELVVLRKPDPEEAIPTKRSASNNNPTTRTTKKRRTSGKSSEIQGALALIELARN